MYGPRSCQETAQDERLVPGKITRPLGCDVATQSRRRRSGEEAEAGEDHEDDEAEEEDEDENDDDHGDDHGDDDDEQQQQRLRHCGGWRWQPPRSPAARARRGTASA